MKNQRLGFSLIEVLIAIAIGSFLTLSLYQILSRVQQAVRNINTVVDLNSPLVPLYNNLEKDFLGLFVPTNIEQLDAKKTDTKVPAEGAKKEEAKIKNVFVSSSKDGALNFNFVTTAGLQTIDSKGEIKPASYLRRVVYKMEKDSQDPDTYILWYGDTENLDPEAIGKVQFYELAWRLKKLEISFKVYEPEKESKDQKEQEKTLVELKQFDPKEVAEKYKTVIPAMIILKGIITDQTKTREESFNFNFAIPGYKYPAAEKKQQPEEKKEAPKVASTVVPSPNMRVTSRPLNAGTPLGRRS